jgi:predicted amidohydrolase YtcJ
MRTLLVAAGLHALAPQRPGVRALLVDGDRLAWLGEPAQAPPADRTVDLGGAWITPAFVDAHVHATATGLEERAVDLGGAAGLAEALDRLRRHAASTSGPVVLGLRWDDASWPEGRPPTAAEVAAAAPGRTVLLERVDSHSCVVDPGTLARLPLERLAGVEFGPDREPTGWLAEQASQAAHALVYGQLPPGQVDEARAAACDRAARLGIASLHEMGHPGLFGLDDARDWASGDWPVEVLVWWAELDADAGPRHGLRPGGDLFLDGSIGSRTAAVSGGYRDGRDDGTLFHDDEDVAAFFTACTAAGRGAGVHAIGDRAIEQAIAALEAAAGVLGADAVRRCRHRVEHVELPRPDHPHRMAALNVTASVQPAFDAAWGGSAGLYAQRFGAEAALASNPFADLAEAGVRLALRSDSTVTPLDPWGAVIAAERHRGSASLPRAEALAAHVLGGRYAAGQDDVGPLLPGFRADLAVWDGDPLGGGDPRTVTCLATVAKGRLACGTMDLE